MSSNALDSFELELENLLNQDEELVQTNLDVQLRDQLPPEVREQLTLGATLGQGGFGVVIHAFDLARAQPCALKILQVSGLSSEQRAKIKREYRAGRRLEHPHIVRTWDMFEGDSVWAFTMERMENSLRGHLRAHGPIGLEHLLYIAQEALAALDFVHSERVVHRDLKPSNILLCPGTEDGVPGLAKLADFGIARFGEPGEDPSQKQTGTPQYMPPEMFDEGRFDPRGDLYALGLMLLELLTGEHPLGPLNAQDWPRRHRDVFAKRPDGLPDAIWEVLAALIQKRPERRPKTAREACETLMARHPPRCPLPTLRGGIYLAAPPLIGRSKELTFSRTYLAQRLSGTTTRAPVLLLTGPAGIGKSRLLRELVRTDDLGAIILHGKGHRHDRTPFAALGRILSHLQEWNNGDAQEPTLDPFAMTVDPYSATLTMGAEGRPSTGKVETTRTADDHVEAGLRIFLRRQADALLIASNRRPYLLVVEDVHWCDDASVEMLFWFAQALASVPGSPAALLMTTRPPEPDTPAARLRERLSDAGFVDQLALTPLDTNATARLVSSLLLDAQRGASLATRLSEDAEMTPLLVIQTLHLLLVRGSLAESDDLDLTHLPGTVQQIVGERVVRLSGLAKELLAMSAVLGSQFTTGELAACLGSETLELLDYLDEAERKGFISQRMGASDIYQFVHDELRDALLNGLGEEGVALHRRAADGLIQVYEDADAVAARVAYHMDACETWPEAWAWGCRAAEAALVRQGFRASSELFDRAFRAAHFADIDPEPRIRQRRGDALLFSGRYADAGASYRAALDRITNDEDREVRILGRLAELEYRASRLTYATAPLETLLPRLGGTVPHSPDALKRVTASLQTQLEREIEGSQTPLALPEHERTRSEVLCRTYQSLAEVAYYFQPTHKAYYSAAACCLALRLGSTSAAAQSLGVAAFFSAQQGRFALAEQMAAKAVEAADGCADPIAQMFTRSFVASVRLMSGAPEVAAALSLEPWKLAQRVAEPLRMMTVGGIQALALAAAGRSDEGAQVAATLRTLGTRYGYTRVQEMGFVCGCASALAALNFDDVLAHAEPADRMELSGSRMLALQLRSYASVANAFLSAKPDAEAALMLAERWHEADFESMTCNIDGHALLVGALAHTTLTQALVERFERRVQEGWEVAHRNRAKTGLFLASAGLLALTQGREQGKQHLDDGIAHAHSHGLHGELALIEFACSLLLTH